MAFLTDYQFIRPAIRLPRHQANQAWGWKGEWWAYGGTMIYSHTMTPNRIACQYQDQNTRLAGYDHWGPPARTIREGSTLASWTARSGSSRAR